MKINFGEITGTVLVLLYLVWILIYYYYGAVKIYNLTEKKQYRYLGCLWIHKQKGEYYLRIPGEMIEESVTTEYKLVLENLFVKQKEEQRVRICFEDKYDAFAKIAEEISVKNYIATSNQL